MAPFDRILYWDKFGRPGRVPLQGPNVLHWWIDQEKASTLNRRRGAVGSADEESSHGVARGSTRTSEGLAAYDRLHHPQHAADHHDAVRHHGGALHRRAGAARPPGRAG